MIAIKLENVCKEFNLERKKELTLKERFINFSKNLRKKRKNEKIIALKNINLSIKSGECFGILGENGSGKTTLLKVIAGIIQPDKGDVITNGKILPILSLGIGFQKELTAKENVYIYGSILGMKKKEIEEKYDQIVKFAELKNMMDVKLRDFSDGMIMRLSFSIAFHTDADIILIDELLSVGDADFQTKCLEMIRRIKEEGKTIVLVMHSPSDIKKFCDRALILKRGRIISLGPSEKVCEKYDEMMESKRLKRLNRIVEKENNIKFNVVGAYPFILKTGGKCRITIKTKDVGKINELLFTGNSIVRVFSNKIVKNNVIFSTNSLPIEEGQYDVWVKCDDKLLNKSPFKVVVKYFKESNENKLFMLPGKNNPFYDLTIVSGEDGKKEFDKFKEGKTIFVYKDLDKMNKQLCLFEKGELITSSNSENVVNEFKKRIWLEFATKYFYDILVRTDLGKKAMGIK